MKIFYKQDRMLKIDRTQLSDSANNTEVMTALYADAYAEFFGATEQLKYKDLSNKQRFDALNTFATKWLTDRGY